MTSQRPAREESEHIIHMLVDKYPQCFFEQPSQRRPLKKDIAHDLKEDGFPATVELIKAGVDWYQSHFGYHHALQAGAFRVDLTGKAVGKVTQAEALKAKTYIADRQREQRELRELNDGFIATMKPKEPHTDMSRGPIEIMSSLHRAGEVPDDAMRKIPAPELKSKPPTVSIDDPVDRLQEKLDAIRHAMDTPDPALRTAFAVAGLGVLIKEAERLADQLSKPNASSRGSP